MCFISGIRDFILVHDRHLLKGLFACGLTAWLALPVIGVLAGHRFVAHDVLDAFSVALTILGWLAYSRLRRRFVRAMVAFTLTTPAYLAAQAPPPMEIWRDHRVRS